MEFVSKNCIKGLPISDANELLNLAQNKKSVYTRIWGVKPAEILIGMQFRLIVKMIQRNEIFTAINLKNIK